MKNKFKKLISVTFSALLLMLAVTSGVYALQSPADNITVAEGISVAARMHAAAYSGTIPSADGEWYQAYVNYGMSNGLIKNGQFDSYTRELKRYELAQIIAAVFPSLETVNDLERIPDVSVTEPYEQDVLYLYNAGVLAGVDSYGTFYPFDSVKRSELSAITQRATDIGRRVVKDFDIVPARTFTDAYLMADVGNGDGRYGIANAWKYDNRFDMFNKTGADYNKFADTSTVDHMSISRKVNEENEGIISVELGLRMCGTARGVYAAFLSPDMEPLVSFTPINGKLAMVGTNTVTSNIAVGESGEVKMLIDMDIDLDKNTATAIVNNQYVGTVNIPDLSFGYIDLASTKEGKGALTFEFCKMYKNYVLAEHFAGVESVMVGGNLTGWQSNGFKLQKMVSSSHGWTDYDNYDDYSAMTSAAAGTTSTASKTFEATTGKVYFSTYILLPEKTDGAVVSLKSAGNDAIKFETKNGKFVCNGTELYDYVDNAWYRLSVDADTITGKAVVKINNKKKAEIQFSAKYFDSVDIKFAPAKAAVMWFDDVELTPLVDHYDYPSAPVVAESKNYNIGINVCNLWRDSSSAEGWDVISPFPEMDLAMGYYDEGLRETADWETKIMAEHGIDFMHMCWYSPGGNIKNPIKRAMRMENLEDGYMNSEYSEYVDFCIMWENGQRVDSFEDFKNYIWKYWVENYFKDERYARLDNKAVISIFNLEHFTQDFDPNYKNGDATWSTDGAKAAIAFMKEDIKNYGYDGLIILIPNDTARTKSDYQNLAAMGFDASYAYNYGTSGYSPMFQQNQMTTLRQNAGSYMQIIPTVATGFNSIGRHDERTPFITAQDHLTVCQFAKQELTRYSTGTWKDKTLIISTWNEYSEGHFVNPSPTTGGWALLDNIKNTFTSVTGDHSDVDIMPTEVQKDRINRTYPDNYSPIRRFRLEDDGSAGDYDEVLAYSFGSSNQSWNISHGISTGVWGFGSGLTNDSSERALKVVANKADHGIKRTFGSSAFNASDAPIMYIRMKTEFADVSEIFFSTADDGSFTSQQYISFHHKQAGEWVEYYIDLTQNELYTGKITAIRFDPMNVVGTSYISKIAFLDYSEEETYEVYVNGSEMKFSPDVELTSDGDFKVTGEARNLGFYTSLRLRYDWDRFTGDGVLKLTTYKDTEVVLTVGSNRATVNGVEKDLGYTFSLYDGLPVFEMKKLCNLLGYKYTVNGNKLRIQACDDEIYDALLEEISDDKTWVFSIPEDTSGWTLSSNCEFETSNGTIKITPLAGKNDPIMMRTMSFNASDYVQLKIGVKYDSSAMNTQIPQIFFTTTASTGMSADKCINGTYVIPAGAKDGDIIEAVFNLKSNAKFTGTITLIRFDPYNLGNTCYIDYVRLYKTGNVLDTSLSTEFDSASDVSKYTYGAVHGVHENGFAVLYARRSSDPYITTAVNYKAEDYDTVIVRVKYNDAMIQRDLNDTATIPTMRFTTSSNASWGEEKVVTGTYNFETLDQNGFIDLEFVLSNNAYYTGTITGLRFDPYQLDVPYEIDEIRLSKSVGFEFTDNSTSGWVFNVSTGSASDGFLKLTATGTDVFIYNSLALNCDDYIRAAVGVKYIPEVMDNNAPQIFFTTTASTGFSGDKCITGKYIIPEGTKEGMVVRAVFDLKSKDLFTGRLKQIRFDPFNVKTNCEIDYIRFYDEGYPVDESVSFEFDGNNTGWIFQNCTASYKNGFMGVTANSGSNDPNIIHNLKLNCDDYRKVVVGIKYNSALMSQFKPELFFTTKASTTLSADKCIIGTYPIPDDVKEGDIIRAVFDLKSNDKFTGTLSQIRFDPWQNATNFEIDYIRFYK